MQEGKTKNTHPKTYNHIQSTHKPAPYYQHPQPQQQIFYQPQYVPVPVIAKTAYVPQPQQQVPTMIIITGPPTPAAYSAPIQQLLNYFHSNPQARQQLLYGSNQQPAATPAYVVAAAPAQYYTTTPTQYYYAPQQEQQPQQQEGLPQPLQLQQLAEVAQTTAQRLYGGQIKSAPPIVTGLENFTPEQQAQIKARLNDVISQDQQQQHHQQQRHHQQHHQQHGAVMNDFVPSPEIKGEEGGVAYVSDEQGYATKG